MTRNEKQFDDMTANVASESLMNSIVDSFESMLVSDASWPAKSVADFLPSSRHPEFGKILVELIRIEIEHSWTMASPTPVASYLESFPSLLNDREGLEAICFEEYRQRLQAGHEPNAIEYREKYRVCIEEWPPSNSRTPSSHSSPSVRESEAKGFPALGETFVGFELIRELGRGAFARVYLAKQFGLSNRSVALKVARHRFSDANVLARLQHTNIVPIYSVHCEGTILSQHLGCLS